MDVSIIIVNYKTVDLILNCLKSVYTLVRGVSYEIIVVDNNSEDDYQNRIQEAFPEVICISLPENVGFGRANNEGIKVAKGRNILFLNPDTVLINDAVSILSKYLDNNINVGACGGNLYDEDLNLTLSFRRIFPSIMWEINDFLHQMPEKICYNNNRKYNTTDKPLKVAYITGADLMVRMDTLIEIGLFSPSFFMYYEETDLCFRIKSRGFEVVSVPDAKIQHLEGKSFKTKSNEINEKKIFIIEKSRLNFYQRNYSSPYRIIVNVLYRIFILSRVMLSAKGRKREIFLSKIKALNELS